ncbi:hypothetical protein D3C83_215350 [compost metagenome]
MQSVDSSISTSTGVAPTPVTADAHATHVRPVTSTSRPGPAPTASRAMVSADEPWHVGTQKGTPGSGAKAAAKRCS